MRIAFFWRRLLCLRGSGSIPPRVYRADKARQAKTRFSRPTVSRNSPRRIRRRRFSGAFPLHLGAALALGPVRAHHLSMDEQFESRSLLPPASLKSLLERRTWPSLWRLTIHLFAFVTVGAALTVYATNPLFALPLSIALAWIWSGLFAPFHECTHRTAFRSPRGNRLGAWITGVPFGMARDGTLICTKAGGFGAPDTLARCVARLKREMKRI